jgi:DNA-binding response OmpR family regulator
MSILLADDDIHLANFLSKSLESEGYSVHTALNEDSVLSELKRQNYKLIILDLNFGETDGLKLLEKLRAAGLETPVMVLSARNRISDRIQSLNLGADDYITKPFSFQELAARANALLRRKADPQLNVLRVENLVLDPASRKVHRGKREIKLSPKEFELLYLLMRRAGETVGRQELLRESWGLELASDSNLVDVYVNYLRKKIDLRDEEKLIHTVRGSGYRIGRPAPQQAAGDHLRSQPSDMIGETSFDYFESGAERAEDLEGLQRALRALIHSLVHDLAQPLTSLRCFLELAAMPRAAGSVEAADLRMTEQQADRAIALTKAISALVMESPAAAGTWTSLDALLNDIFNDFIVLIHSGLLVLDRQWHESIQVTASPALRQLLVVLVSKLVGRNTRPLTVTITAHLAEDCCMLGLQWRGNDEAEEAIQDAHSIFFKDQHHLQTLAESLGGELSLPGRAEVELRLPTGPKGPRLGHELPN